MPLVIHVWPGRWDLPSFDPACLAAILYLQMAFRGQFSVVEEANPDLSPSGLCSFTNSVSLRNLQPSYTGQLPYLTHLSHSISPLASIIAYLGALDPETFAQLSNSQSFELIPSLDAALSSTQRNQTVVWRAYIEFHVGDLVVSGLLGLFECSDATYSAPQEPFFLLFSSELHRFHAPVASFYVALAPGLLRAGSLS